MTDAPTPPRPVHELIAASSGGDRAALDELMPLLYAELRREARRYLRERAGGATLDATGLVHEAYLRLAGQASLEWQSRAHLFRTAAKVMRTVLVDHARARHAAKRGGGHRQLTLGAADSVATPASTVDVLALDEALTRLAAMDPDKARLVELRYFAGLSIEATAEAMGKSPATVKRDWSVARAWLHRELAADG
jgi:RNA polymerase sigma factor (TIGR02999 family)